MTILIWTSQQREFFCCCRIWRWLWRWICRTAFDNRLYL